MKVHSMKRGQLTLIDLVMIPVIALTVSSLAYEFLQSSTATIINQVNLQQVQESCAFGLNALFNDYYVHTAASLVSLKEFHPDQYAAATAAPAQVRYANCGSNCSLGYTVLQASLPGDPSLYVDFVTYYSSFALSTFNLTVSNNYYTLNNYGMQVFLNAIPPLSYTPSYICSMPAFNPQNPSQPYTIYGVVR